MKNINQSSARHNVDDVIDCTFSIEGNGLPLSLVYSIGAARNAWRFLLPVLNKILQSLLMTCEGMENHRFPMANSYWMNLSTTWSVCERKRESNATRDRVRVASSPPFCVSL